MKINCKIGFMSFLMIASVLIIFLTVPGYSVYELQISWYLFNSKLCKILYSLLYTYLSVLFLFILVWVKCRKSWSRRTMHWTVWNDFWLCDCLHQDGIPIWPMCWLGKSESVLLWPLNVLKIINNNQ